MKKLPRLTIVELLVIVVFLAAATAVLLYQRGNIVASQQDEDRKTAINAMYYNLEEVFYKQNGHYPSMIDEMNLTAMDAELFIDPEGMKIGETGADYRYDAIDCRDDVCQAYKLTGRLEKEADYTKTNRN